MTFKALLAIEFLIGSIFIVKTVLFTKAMADRYKVQAFTDQKRSEKERIRADIRKKVLKKAGISKDKERAVLTMSLSEL